MNRKNTVVDTENEVLESGEYAVKRSRRSGVIAAILCLLFSLLVWVFVMNTDETRRLELTVTGGPADAAYSYELSVSELEVHGKLIYLRNLESIELSLPETLVAGESYLLTESNVHLPDGVRPAGPVEILLTVTAK